jgi:hypothetical protein
MFTIKQYDDRRMLPIVVTDENGVGADCTGLTAYAIGKATTKSGPVVRLPVTWTTQSEGVGEASPPTGGFPIADTWRFEVETYDAAGLRDTTIGYVDILVEDDIGNAPTSATMAGGTVDVTHLTQDTGNRALGTVPVGAEVSAWRDGEPVASVISLDGTFSLTLVPGSTYTIKVYFPGYTKADRLVTP